MLLWNDTISESESHMEFKVHCEVQFSRRFLALDIVLENMDFSSMWKYTRQYIRDLDKEVVGVLSYNSIESVLMKKWSQGKRLNSNCCNIQSKQMKVIEPRKT
jgi:hypothetical protein